MSNSGTIRCTLSCMLALGLCVLSGCTKKEEQSSQQPITTNSGPVAPASTSPTKSKPFASLTDRNAQPTVLASPPPDMFDLAAHPDASILTAININSLTESEREFGIAPRRTKDVDYADGVIVMENGDKAIRSMSGDGMSWTFDASAEHVKEFQVGKIVFATGRAVGRILSLKQEGNSVTAFLGPVQLTDVIKRGHFAMSQKVDTENMLTYVAPDFPQPPDVLVGGTEKTSSNYDDADDAQLVRTVVISRVQHGRWTPTSVSETYGDGRRVTYQKQASQWSQGRVSLANVSKVKLANPVELARLSTPPELGPEIPTAAPMQIGGTAGSAAGKIVPLNLDGDDVRTKAVATNSGIGLQFYYHKHGVNLYSECLLRVIGAHVDFDLNITSQGIETAGVKIDGDMAIVMQAEAASEQNYANLKKTYYEPIDFSIPLGLNGALGVPFSVTFGSHLTLETGFSAKNSKLTAEGVYTFGGGLWAGMKNYEWSVSAAAHPQAEKDLALTTTGVSVGINSLVVGASIRAMVGIGAFGFNTGVFVEIIFDGTILRGSDIASPIVGLQPCRQGTIGAYLYYGVGYSMPKVFVQIVNKILGLFTSYQLKEEGDIMSSKPADLFHGRTQSPANCASSDKAGT